MSDLAFLTPAAAGRWDIYGPIHKGLRFAHAEMTMRLGRADFGADQSELLAELKRHLAMGAKHLAHEEEHIHAALEARAPGATSALEGQHDHHRARFEVLAAAIRALEHAAPTDRPALGRLLYLGFTGFVAEDLEHMAQEETEVWPQLCALFTDEELMGVEMAIVGSLAPEENIAFMRIMLPAMNPLERAGLLTGMKAGAPPEAYAAVIEHAARPTLPANDFAELERLGLAA
jgi:hypothetical protein